MRRPDHARPTPDPPTPADFPRLLLGRWQKHWFSFKYDWIYFRRYTFAADGTAVYESWQMIDSIGDNERYAYAAIHGRYRFTAPDEVLFEPETPEAAPATVRVRANIWPVGDIHIESTDGHAFSAFWRWKNDAA